ncbi:MAG TPA: twin-arginine translocase subunit TatC, partial [Gemmatimonadales bacterium]
VMLILSWLGVVGPRELNRFRRYAIVLAFIAGAILSPGADVLSMAMMTLPLLVLYEVGVAGSVVLHRRRQRGAAEPMAGKVAGVLLLLSLGGVSAEAQIPGQQRRPPQQRSDTLRQRLSDTAQARAGQSLDTATARRMGLPTQPSRSFAQPDSVVSELLARPGYQSTRYRADSATVFVQEERVLLKGKALTERRGTSLEAESITYRRASCVLDASGDPRLFDRGQVLVGEGIRYDTCVRRGVITDALTNFSEGSTVWFLRGDVSQDSSSSRIYAASSEISSCDLPVPHYHFAGREVKWVSRSVLVARPVVLYVRDVPIMWLPFIFQDMRPGRHSGILIPQFGFNDLVRPSRSYNRQITNLGYYWAPNDYIDLTGRLDWYSNRYLQYGVGGQYSWINRFMDGSVAFSKQQQSEGGSSTTLRWDHRQTFDLSTSLNLDLNYASNTSVIQRNAIDPLLNTQQITSSLNFSKRYGWGTLTIGGNRRQSLSDGSVQQLLPALTISPASIALGSNITWSPGLSFTNNTESKTPLDSIEVVLPGGGGLDTVGQLGSNRSTTLDFQTPVRIGNFNWQNSLQVADERRTGRDSIIFRVDDPTTPDPTDSTTITQFFGGSFSSALDWNTGINLPVLFRGSWKVQPAVGIANTTSGPFLLRNRNTNGNFVHQGKRFRFSATASPTLFAFLPGFGLASRIRHSLSPSLSWNYSPAANVPEEYARAIAQPGQALQLRSDATQTMSLGLSQTFEAKAKQAPGDTAATTDARKFRVLSINTSPISYDFEQAKKPGRTGWATETITNSFLSDLLPQFTLSLTHDLWRGALGVDTTHFDPFLSSVSASFAISSNTLRAIGSIFGLGGKGPRRGEGDVPSSYVADAGRRNRGSFYNSGQVPFSSGGRSFSANFNYTLSRQRPVPGVADPTDQQNLGFSTSFS